MKLTFIYNDISLDQRPRYNFAIGNLSACLKEAGHLVSLLHYTRPVDPRVVVDDVENESPDLLGFTSTTNTYRHDKAMAEAIRRRLDLPIVCGGIHPTLAPAETLGAGAFDMVCVGEGDHALPELCDGIEHGRLEIPNIWRRADGRILRTPVRPPIEDLDALPFMDRDVFDYERLEESRRGYARVMISRGCPFSCTYCCNHSVKAIYKGMGRYVRVQSVSRAMEEIEDLLGSYPFIKYLIFYDSNFPLEVRWLSAFSVEYRRRIGVPFSCNCRPDLMNSEVARLLAEAGCHKVRFGVESGSEELRGKVLGRSITRRQISHAFELCRERGLSTHSSNIIGIPFETPATALDTIRLNAEIDPDQVWRATFYPYPGTELFDLCKRHNLLTDRVYDTYFEGTVLAQGSISEGQVNFLFQFYSLLVLWYKLLGKLPPPLRVLGDSATERVVSSDWFPHGLLARLKRAAMKKMLEIAPRMMLMIMPTGDE